MFDGDPELERNFLAVVDNQLSGLSKAARLKGALDDHEVIAGFEAADDDDRELYFDFINFVSEKHLLFPDEVAEVAARLAIRSTGSKDA